MKPDLEKEYRQSESDEGCAFLGLGCSIFLMVIGTLIFFFILERC